MRAPRHPITVKIVGPMPSPREVAERFVALAIRKGWLDEEMPYPEPPDRLHREETSS